VLAGVAVLQALGLDPFAWGGWQRDHPGERMRVYGTLGNPDFVAAFLGASLCVTVGEVLSTRGRAHRAAWAAATALQLGALASTRSWASLLALGAAALTVGLGGVNPHPGPLPEGEGISTGATPLAPRTWRLVALLALGALALLVLVPWGRSLGASLEGRRYLLNVAAPHAVDRPVLGHGPDSFEVLWPAWEAAYWEAGAPEAQRRFAAPQNHAHNDYLEWWLELGLVGTAPRVLLLLAALHAGLRAVDARGLATTAALAALAARALVDFPFSRPAGLCLLAVLLALPLRLRSQS
jgi:O-antigen ligase